MKRLSIIVPIYNVEAYLERCVDSLLNQDLEPSDYEIIMVDDGSTDGSGALADQLCQKGTNLVCVHQANKGLSGARNTGLAHAVGEWIWFVDSDDAIEPNCLKNLLDYGTQSGATSLHLGYTHIFNEGPSQTYLPAGLERGKVVSGQQFFCELHVVPTAWSYLHKRDFLVKHGLRFFEGIIHEDEEFLPRFLWFCPGIALYPHALYRYYQNSASIMGTKNVKSDLHKLKVMESFSAFLSQHTLTPTFENRLWYRAFILYQTILHPSQFLRHKPADRQMLLEKLKQTNFYPIGNCGPLSLKFRAYRWLMNLSLPLYVTLRRWL